MGRDKALLTWPDQAPGSRTLLERTVDVLAPLASEVWLACGDESRYEAIHRLAGEGRVPVGSALDVFHEAGPLAGVHAGLVRSKSTWILLAACDLPRIETGLFAALLERAKARQLDVCMLQTEEAGGPRDHPSIAVLRRTVFEPVARSLGSGRRRLDAFHGEPGADGRALAVGVLTERELPIELRDRQISLNLNTADDLARERTQQPRNHREVAG